MVLVSPPLMKTLGGSRELTTNRESEEPSETGIINAL